MNIAVDTNCILPGKVGGIENYTAALIEALLGADSPANRVAVLTRPENHGRFLPFQSAGARIELIDRPVGNWAAVDPSDRARSQAALTEFQSAKSDRLRQLDIDVVHFPGNTINPVGIDLPVVLNLHDLQHRHFPEYFTADELENRERWWTASAHRADAMIAASKFVRDDLVRQLDLDGGKIFVTPDPVEAAFGVDPGPEAVEEIRNKYTVAETSFLYPAAFWPHKNHGRLIAAFAAADVPGSQLLLTGGGQEDGRLARLIDDAGMTGRVRPLGRVPTRDLIGLYRSVTAAIVPSLHESWSIPIAEAMACGCPVASSRATSLPEQVGHAGILFDAADVPAMRSAIRWLARDAELRTTLAERGKVRVDSAGTKTFIATLERAYRHAIASRSLSRKAA